MQGYVLFSRYLTGSTYIHTKGLALHGGFVNKQLTTLRNLAQHPRAEQGGKTNTFRTNEYYFTEVLSTINRPSKLGAKYPRVEQGGIEYVLYERVLLYVVRSAGDQKKKTTTLDPRIITIIIRLAIRHRAA